MAHIVHCRVCKQEIDIETQQDWVMPTARWYYHQVCYTDFAKKREIIKEGDIELIEDDKFWEEALYDYLHKDLKISINYSKFHGQWTNFLKKNMTAKGIYFTMRYFYDIAKGDRNKSENGIGIVPYIYTEGTSYWGERNRRDKDICARIEAQIIASRQPTRIILQKERTPAKPQIDLSTIALMEDEE